MSFCKHATPCAWHGITPSQSEGLSQLQRRAAFFEQSLSKEKARRADLEEEAARIEAARADAAARCEAYESGVYGLPQVRRAELPACAVLRAARCGAMQTHMCMPETSLQSVAARHVSRLALCPHVQAAMEIRQLKEMLAGSEARVREIAGCTYDSGHLPLPL